MDMQCWRVRPFPFADSLTAIPKDALGLGAMPPGRFLGGRWVRFGATL